VSRELLKDIVMPDRNTSPQDNGNSTSERSGSGDRTYTSAVHGTDSSGKDVTASFGRDGTSREGHTLISDGHKSDSAFYKDGGHDHADGKGGSSDRGAYTSDDDD
jgi:hypothetical protein